MNNVRLTIVWVLVFVFFAPAIVALGVRFLPDRQMPETGGSVKVYSGKDLNLDLGATKNNLVGVVVRVKNSTRSNTSLELKLLDNKNNLVGGSSLNGLSILDGSEVRFSFSPLPVGNYRAVFFSDAIEPDAMEIYLKKGSDKPAYFLLYRPASRLGLIGNIYFGWFKHLFAN